MSSSHRQSGRDTDKTVLSCLSWRCELALMLKLHYFDFFVDLLQDLLHTTNLREINLFAGTHNKQKFNNEISTMAGYQKRHWPINAGHL